MSFHSKRVTLVAVLFVLAVGIARQNSVADDDLVHVFSGVVKSVDKTTKTVVVKSADGTERTIKYTDKTTGKVYEQPTAGWYRPADKGMVFYFMVGHKATDYDNPVYAQILANAVTFALKK